MEEKRLTCVCLFGGRIYGIGKCKPGKGSLAVFKGAKKLFRAFLVNGQQAAAHPVHTESGEPGADLGKAARIDIGKGPLHMEAVTGGRDVHHLRFVVIEQSLNFRQKGGLAFVQFFVLDKMFGFIQGFTPTSVAATPDIASYVESILSLYLAFGMAFQVPIVVMLLVRFGIVEIDKLKAFRGYFIVVAFVIAAVVTPPDVISQLALAIPMCVLYEVGILGAGWFLRVSKAPEDNEEA